MKRWGVVVTVLALTLAAGLIYAAEKITTQTGTVTITLSYADSTGFVTTGFTPIQISDMTNGNAEFNDFQWDRIVGVFYTPLFTEITDSAAYEAKVDTIILRYIFGSKQYSYIAEIDTGSLPDTEYFVISRDAWADPSKWVGGDSTSAYAYPNYEGDAHALDMDQFWIEYYCTDTAGASGRMSTTLQYYLKFIKDGE